MVDVAAVYAFRGVDAMAFKRLEVAGVREPVQFIEIVDEIRLFGGLCGLAAR